MDPENYRKITVISVIHVGKIFEGIINNKIVFEALQMEDLFQNGFQFRARATDNVLCLTLW